MDKIGVKTNTMERLVHFFILIAFVLLAGYKTSPYIN